MRILAATGTETLPEFCRSLARELSLGPGGPGLVQESRSSRTLVWNIRIGLGRSRTRSGSSRAMYMSYIVAVLHKLRRPHLRCRGRRKLRTPTEIRTALLRKELAVVVSSHYRTPKGSATRCSLGRACLGIDGTMFYFFCPSVRRSCRLFVAAGGQVRI